MIKWRRKMRKNKNGITLISLIFTIIVLLVLTSIFIATSLNALNEAESSEIQAEIHALEEATLERYTSYLKNNQSSNVVLVGISPTTRWSSAEECVTEILTLVDFSKMTSTQDKTDKINKITADITRDYDEYVKLISQSEALRLGVTQFSEDNVYVVDYFNSTVYGPLKSTIGDE